MTSGSEAQHRRPAFATERIIGASHVRSGKPCQDDVGVWSVGDIVAVAVADGHGSSKHADVGARLAVQVALETLARFADDLGQHASSLTDVHRFAEHPFRVHVVREWAARVRAKAGREDVPLIDYGSTLLFALAAPEFLLIGQIGDGDVLLVGGERQVVTPIPPDPSAFADETPSLCLHEAWHALRVRVLPAPREETLLLLSTDGYSKSYASDKVFHQIGPDYLDLVRTDGLHGLAPHLRGFLEQVTTKGSGDDIAVALLYWPARAAVVASVSQPEAPNESVSPAEPPPSAVHETESSVTAVVDTGPGTAVDPGLGVHVRVDAGDRVPTPSVEVEKGNARTAEDG
jgi:hypothetical protein